MVNEKNATVILALAVVVIAVGAANFKRRVRKMTAEWNAKRDLEKQHLDDLVNRSA